MPTPTTPLETTMANDPDSLTRPQMPNPDDDLRARQQRDLYCVLTNSHDDIAELWFQEHVHDEVIAVWGAPDIGSANSLADGSSQLSVLYVEEPTVLHRDPSGMALVETYMPDYWVGQQWTQYCTLGIGEWLRHVKWDDATEQLVFRHVRPDNCYVVTTSAEPTTTASAPAAMSLAWAGVLMPKPTAIGSRVDLLMRATSAWTAFTSGAAEPVMPVIDT